MTWTVPKDLPVAGQRPGRPRVISEVRKETRNQKDIYRKKAWRKWQRPQRRQRGLADLLFKRYKKFITLSKPIAEENITTFREPRNEVYNKIIKHNEESGIMCDSFNWYNQKTKGFRKGELTVITGEQAQARPLLCLSFRLAFAKRNPNSLGQFRNQKRSAAEKTAYPVRENWNNFEAWAFQRFRRQFPRTSALHAEVFRVNRYRKNSGHDGLCDLCGRYRPYCGR